MPDVRNGYSHAVRFATMNGKGEVVAGMILKILGTNTLQVISGVKTRMAELNKVLPPGIHIVSYHDQATLVKKCVSTVMSALLQAVLLIIVIQLLMMGSLRPSIVVFFSIPFSLGFGFLLMKYLGILAKLMSLGGLAIALSIVLIITGLLFFNQLGSEFVPKLNEGDLLVTSALYKWFSDIPKGDSTEPKIVQP